jgi:hypothetical protein
MLHEYGGESAVAPVFTDRHRAFAAPPVRLRTETGNADLALGRAFRDQGDERGIALGVGMRELVETALARAQASSTPDSTPAATSASSSRAI